MYGTYEAFRYKVPGLHKVRYIGQVGFCTACTRCLPRLRLALLAAACPLALACSLGWHGTH